MNARELTKEVMEQQNRIIDLEREVRYLNDKIEKLTLFVNDHLYDDRPNQRGREALNNGNL